MSKKQWILLFFLYVSYLLLGAAIFYYIESGEEVKRAQEEAEERAKLETILREHFRGNYSIRKRFLSSLTNYCGKPFGDDSSVTYRWDFYHSLFFVITVVSTIGYGNLAPTTMFTRLFMIFYGLIGIPMNGIVVFTLGEYFGRSKQEGIANSKMSYYTGDLFENQKTMAFCMKWFSIIIIFDISGNRIQMGGASPSWDTWYIFTKLHQRWKNSKIDYDMAKLGLVGQVVLYLVPGFTFFIFLPSTIMTVFEGWEYDVSVYYCFVSLTTIGFGDYVAGTTKPSDLAAYYALYKIFLLVWIIGGMGYLAMLLSFITRGMRSKKVKIIERILTENIKNTPKKIREELQTLLHELLFLRIKPVYKDDFDLYPLRVEQLSKSCPNLTILDNDYASKFRKRAVSEGNRPALQNYYSDSDLNKIDKERTFSSSKRFLEQTDLLFKVVGALSSESLPKSDVIRRDEEHPVIRNTLSISKKRRAISDIRPPSILTSFKENGNTWYGADAEQAIAEYRKHYASKPEDIKKTENPTIFKKLKRRLLSRDESNSDIEKQIIPPENHVKVRKRKESVSPLSLPPTTNQVLETTSIAEFIRALSVVTAPDLSKLDTSRARKISRNQDVDVSTVVGRRSSIACGSLCVPDDNKQSRRLSLKPVEEHLLSDSVKLREAIRKKSTSFQDDKGNSWSLGAWGSIPPTVEENVSYSAQAQSSSTKNEAAPGRRTRKFSVRTVFHHQ